MMQRKGKKRVRRSMLRRAAATVELAVVSPVLFAALFGIIEFGWLFTVQNSMVNAARDAARHGALQGTEMDEVEARARELLEPLGLSTDVHVAVEEPTQADPVVTVRVSIPREQVSLFGEFFNFTGGEVSGEASMKREGM